MKSHQAAAASQQTLTAPRHETLNGENKDFAASAQEKEAIEGESLDNIITAATSRGETIEMLEETDADCLI